MASRQGRLNRNLLQSKSRYIAGTMGRKTTTLRWCPECDIPVIDRRSCPVCGAGAMDIEMPANDMRPAFPYDLALIRSLISEFYGCDAEGFLDGCVAILYGNPCSSQGLNVLAHGRMVATYRIDMEGREIVELTLDGVAILPSVITKRSVRVKKSALQYIGTGKNAMATSVVWADPGISAGDQVMVVGPDGSPVAAGIARMSGDEMVSSSEGMAVKVKERRSADRHVVVVPRPIPISRFHILPFGHSRPSQGPV